MASISSRPLLSQQMGLDDDDKLFIYESSDEFLLQLLT